MRDSRPSVVHALLRRQDGETARKSVVVSRQSSVEESRSTFILSPFPLSEATPLSRTPRVMMRLIHGSMRSSSINIARDVAAWCGRKRSAAVRRCSHVSWRSVTCGTGDGPALMRRYTPRKTISVSRAMAASRSLSGIRMRWPLTIKVARPCMAAQMAISV